MANIGQTKKQPIALIEKWQILAKQNKEPITKIYKWRILAKKKKRTDNNNKKMANIGQTGKTFFLQIAIIILVFYIFPKQKK